MYYEIVICAYILDMLFSEYENIKFIKHPIVMIGDYIKWFEKRFYKDEIFRGLLLFSSLIFIVYIICELLNLFDCFILEVFLCSFTISHKMLYEKVLEICNSDNKNELIQMLVSRDTKNLSQSEVNKAAIETYAENLSDGVIAPIFYMLLFGLTGAFIYKTINTLDSMVGYKTNKYINYGKVSARIDDFVNYIPSRITAILISLLFKSYKAFNEFYSYGIKHESPNAGHPIAAIAICLNISLGGPTSYFGKIKNKAYFGNERTNIKTQDVITAISIKYKVDSLIILSLGVIIVLQKMV